MAFLFFSSQAAHLRLVKETAMKKTFDIHVKEFKSLISPTEMKQALPLTDAAVHTVVSGRKEACQFPGIPCKDVSLPAECVYILKNPEPPLDGKA